MATVKYNTDDAKVYKRIKKEIIYEYQPILGEILGFWRKSSEVRMGEDIEVHLNHSLQEYDRLFINGQEIDINNLRSEANQPTLADSL